MACTGSGSRREILNALIARVKSVTTDNGYRFNIVDCHLDLKNPEQLLEHETPMVYIIPTTERRTGGIGGLYRVTWSLDLYTVAKQVSILEMYDLVDDIEDALYGVKGALPKLQGCSINNLRVVDVAIDGQMLTQEQGYSQSLIAIELEWTHQAHRP